MTVPATLYDITATSTFIATTTVVFTEETIPGTSDCTAYTIQCIAYTYDANGNITRIVENASTSAERRVDYTYDDLNRLITASSSNVASGSNYSHTYSYNAIGNILSGPAGTYSYAHATSSYANPHAPLSLTGTSTVTYAYDQNGNLTGTTIGTSTLTSYTWDYRNRISNSSSSNTTSSYRYDSLNQRIELTTGTSTTIYIAMSYNVTGSSTVKNITVNDISIATVSYTTSSVMRYILTDHLGGTNLVTDDSNTVIQTIDYFPYGARRINVGTDVSQREYIGQYYDEESQLSYLNARYYSSDRGQFTSQDPVFWEVGQTEDGRKVLNNPQLQNSYAYAGGNPITQKDPTGRIALVDDAAILTIGAVAIAGTYLYANLLAKNHEPRWGGTVPTLDPAKLGLGPRPMGLEDLIPNLRPDLPKGPKIIVGGLIILGLATEAYSKTKEYIGSFSNNNQSNGSPPPASKPSINSNTSVTNSSQSGGGQGQSISYLRSLLNTLSNLLSQLSRSLSGQNNSK